MPGYLVETFLARGSAGERTARDRRARSSAQELTRNGTRVRFEGSTHIPEDELCFFTFEAPSRTVAELVAQRARLEPLRVVEAISSSEAIGDPSPAYDVSAVERRHPTGGEQ